MQNGETKVMHVRPLLKIELDGKMVLALSEKDVVGMPGTRNMLPSLEDVKTRERCRSLLLEALCLITPMYQRSGDAIGELWAKDKSARPGFHMVTAPIRSTVGYQPTGNPDLDPSKLVPPSGGSSVQKPRG